MKKFLLLLLTSILIISPLFNAQINYDIFIKINKTADIENIINSTPFIMPLVKMKDYYIALASGKELRKFDSENIQYQFLSNYKTNISYYLVNYKSPDSLLKIKTQGEAIILEQGIAFFIYKKQNEPPKLPRDTFISAITISKEKLPVLKPKAIPQLPFIAKDNNIALILSKVSIQEFTNNIAKLQSFKTRYYDREGCFKAANYIFNYFNSLGLQTEYQYFYVYGKQTQNIVATQYGKSDPDNIVLITAHYDSYSYDLDNAPGADDNASGVAAVMEAARILHNYDFDFTIKYIAFGAEELGLYGSAYYATNAANKKEKIIGVINLDMISYVDLIPEELNIASDEKSQWLGNIFVSLTNTYTNIQSVNTVDPSFRWSDHASFWHVNYDAILAIEDLNITNPFYHSPGDTLNTLSLSFGIETTKGAIANVIYLAQLFDPHLPKPPKNITLQSIYSYSLFDARKHIIISWQPNNTNISGYNIYRSDISHYNYTKLNSTLITNSTYKDSYIHPDTLYYYVITSISPNNLESHFSAEVSEND
jgi:hypothetical protein